LPQNLGVRHLVTAPLHRRRGLARTLLLDVIGIARERGIATWSLNVKPENAAALALYRSLGLAPAYEAEIFRVPWELAAALSEAFEERLPWTIAAPDDDAVIERAFGVATGLFASQRSRGRIVIVVGELRSPAAFASFDPHFPGAFPARAKSPAALAAIARAVATLRVPIEDAELPHRATSFQLGLEDSSSAARALAEAGATRLFRVLHLRGPLPA
jgi:hypothetical protein